jgi:hypothetical protein
MMICDGTLKNDPRSYGRSRGPVMPIECEK